MLTTAVVFTAGSLAAAFAATLPQLLLARFIAGLGHGLFLAAASSTAARLAGPGKAGRAVAVVFGGFTLAMAIGVPLSTWLGGGSHGVQFSALLPLLARSDSLDCCSV